MYAEGRVRQDIDFGKSVNGSNLFSKADRNLPHAASAGGDCPDAVSVKRHQAYGSGRDSGADQRGLYRAVRRGWLWLSCDSAVICRNLFRGYMEGKSNILSAPGSRRPEERGDNPAGEPVPGFEWSPGQRRLFGQCCDSRVDR